MKERPILFSGPMVRAIIEGRKTVTRRAVKGLQIPKEDPSKGETRFRWSAVGQRDARYGFCVFGETEEQCAMELGEFGACPYGRRGDRLWVRETWQYADWTEEGEPWICYQADGKRILHLPEDTPGDWAQRLESIWADLSEPSNYAIDNRAADRRWRPNIHMPRWACRILLEVTAVRVERLQDISEEQAIAEGIDVHQQGFFGNGCVTAKAAFRELWWSINGEGDWEANPWVWVVEFKRVTP